MTKGKKLPQGITIRHRPYGTRYRVRVRYQGRNVECGEYTTLRLAKLALDRYKAEVILGTFVSPAEQRRRLREQRKQEKQHAFTLGQWATQWLDLLETGHIDRMNPKPRSAGTLTAYKSTLETHILPTMANRPLVLIDADEVREVVAASRQHGPGAAYSTARTLSSMLNAAVKHKVPGMTSSPYPADLTIAKSPHRKASDIPTPAEVKRIAALMGDYGLAAELAVWCQLRVGEVIGLQRRDFQGLDRPGAATVNIERQWASKTSPPSYQDPKDDSFRTVVLPAALVPRVLEHLDTMVLDDPEAPFFPSPRDKARPISHNALTGRWNKAREQVKPGAHFHTLRHLGLSLYAQLGASNAEVMARGGHKDQEAAARYQHALGTRDRELAAKLSALIENEETK